MARYLSIDYGLKRVGVAVSYGTLAEPVTVLENTPALSQAITTLCKEYKVTDLVVGVSDQKMAELSTTFGTILSNELQLPVHFADETLTSKRVMEKLAHKNKGKQQYRGPIDHFAAAEILEEWLEIQ